MMAESLWGAWLPELVAALKKIEPTPIEQFIVAKADYIRRRHKARVQKVMQEFWER